MFYNSGKTSVYRILYSLFAYIAIYEVGKYYLETKNARSSITLPRAYTVCSILICVLTIILLYKDFTNPALDVITLVNNPFALLTVVPFFLFATGANTKDVESIYSLFGMACIIFYFTWAAKLQAILPYDPTYIASQAILPFFIFSVVAKKKQAIATLFLFSAAAYSINVDTRTLLLKILIFFSLFIVLHIFKNNNFFKCICIVVSFLAIYLMLTNLGPVLMLFKGVIGNNNFDAYDTRTFLYTELFGDMKAQNL
jgi:hypothetical protein